jgi:hypothetical protein
MLTWIMFLKFLDDMEQIAKQEAEMAGKRFRPALEPPYRWRDWAAKPDGVTGDELISFVNNEDIKMMRHQIAKAGQVILSEIWGKKGAIGFVPAEGEGALCTSHFFLFDINPDKIDRRWLQAFFEASYLQGQLDAEAKGTTGYAAV